MVEKLKSGLPANQAYSRGQALLVVVLVLVVTLTVGLSVASRSITSLRTTSEEDTSQRAFSAAEAGIEQALKVGTIGCPVGTVCPLSINGSSALINFTVSQQSGTTVLLLNNGNPVNADDGIDVWLVTRSPVAGIDYTSGWQNPGVGSTLFSVYWTGGIPPCDTSVKSAAIEIQVITGGNVPGVYFAQDRYVYDPCKTRAANFSSGPSNVTIANNTVSGKVFNYVLKNSININGPTYKGILVRITPLYTGAQIAVVSGTGTQGNGGTPFPYQGTVYQSTGSLGGTSRKVTYFKQFVCPPEFCQYSLFQSQ